MRNAWESRDGPGEAQGALVRRARLQFQAQAEFVGGQAARGEARNEAVQQTREQEGERLQQFHGVLEFDLLFEAERLLDGHELALRLATRQFAQAQPFGTQALGNAQRRQRGQVLKPADAPALQGFPQFRRRIEQRDRERAEELGLVALRDDADARKSTRGADGGIGIGSERDVGLHAGFGGPAREGGGYVLWERKETVEAGDVERHGTGRGALDGG